MRAVLLQLLSDRRARIGIFVIGILALLALLAPLFLPYDPAEQLGYDLLQQPPSLAHPFGTDQVGRDVFCRVIAGIRLSLTIATAAVLFSLTIGVCVGLLAGYLGGLVDTVLMRSVDAALAIPRVLLLLVLLTVFPTGIVGLVCVLALTSWFNTSRLVRAEVLSLRERGFVVATNALGYGTLRTLAKHLAPNVIGPVIVAATLGIGHMILIEAGLSYLGAGVQRPMASLGRIIEEGSTLLHQAWWISTFPGIVIVLIVIGFSLVGDGLRDAIDPKSS